VNNPDNNIEFWKQLRKKWAELDASGHQLKVEFKFVTDPKDRNKVLAIDVIQKIDEEIVTETVQHIAKEGYVPLGIADASIEHLTEIYKQTICQLHRDAGHKDATLIVTMSPTSPISGEVRAVLEKKESNNKTIIEVNYSQYYILNALREKMIEMKKDEWSKVKAVYQQNELTFYFDY
jgi:hypothetical protein